jgi:hypothetical protein
MAAILMGTNAAVWKSTSGMVIRKPGKDDYVTQISYHSISLLSWMGNVIEKVAAQLLSGEAERRGQLSNRELGSRTGH